MRESDTKYSSKHFFAAVILLFIFTSASAQPTNCTNSNFELGSFANWTGGTGTPNGNSGNNPGGCCPIQINNWLNTAALLPPRHTIIGSPVTDPNTLNNLVEVAPGGVYSARLGAIQNSFYQANNPGPFPGSKSERLNYTFTVTPNSDLFVYQYAVVLEDPDTIATQHTTAQKPRFEISVLDVNGNYVPNALCGHYLVIADSNIAGFQQGVVTTSSIIHYRDWTTVGIDLSSYIGQTITIQFQVGDCALGGHFGYAYIDCYCGPLGVLAEYCVGQSSVVLTAPPGFSYQWSPTGDTTQAIVVNNPVNGSVYTCQLTAVTGCIANISATVHPTTVVPDFDYNVDCLDTTVTFFDSTFIQYGTISNWQWDFGDGSPLFSGVQNPVHTYPSPGTYNVTLYITTNSNCLSQITLPITIPVVTVSVPGSAMCPGNPVLLTASGVVTYQWSPSAGLSSTTGSTVIASPTTTTTYTVTGFNANGCSGIAQSIVVINPNPVISANASANNLCGTQTISLTASGASSYSWSPNIYLSSSTGSTISAIPLTSVTYTVTGTSASGCTSQTTIPVNVFAAVTITSTGGNICTGQSALLTASGATNYLWSNGSSGNSIFVNPATTTTYTVIGSTGVCSDTSSSVVTVNSPPVLSVLPSQSVCLGDSVLLTASGATNYSWSPSNTLSSSNGSSVTANPLANTTYTVIATNAAGCSAQSIIPVTVNSVPVLIPVSGTICSGGSTSLSVSGASSYIWSPSAGLSASTGSSVIANPTLTTTYNITGTNVSGCTASALSTVVVNPLPLVTSSQGNNICVNGSILLTASGALNYQWSPSTSLSSSSGNSVTANPISTTTYTVTGTDINGCTAISTSIVNVNPIPSLVCSPDDSICFGGSITLSATGAISYSWSPSTGLSATSGSSVIATPSSNITYTVTGTNGTNCSASTSTFVKVNPIPIVNAVPSSSAICLSSSAIITASGAQNYSWSPSTGLSASTGNSVTANPASTITYTVTGTDVNGCSASSQASLIVNPPPVISIASTNPVICLGGNSVLNASGAMNYTWSPSTFLNATTGASVISTPTSNITYTVDAIDSNGCSSSSTSLMTVNPLPNLSVTAPDTICSGASVTLTAAGAVSYSWSPSTGLSATSGSSVIATPSSNITYTVTGTNGTNCSASTSTFVKVNPIPIVNAVPSSSAICLSSSAIITASGAQNYSWSPSTGLSASTGNSVTANPASTITYTVTGTDVNGCSASSQASLIVNPPPVISIASTNPVICLGGNSVLNASGAMNYTWSPSTFLNATTGASVISTPTSNITYTVDAIDSNGCSASSTSLMTVNPLPIIVPSSVDSSICLGTSTVLSASGAITYVWSPSIGLSSSTGNSVTCNTQSSINYTVTGTNANGCSALASIPVTVYSLPSVTISNNPSICPGSFATLTASGALNYLWSTNAIGNIISVNPIITTSYTVTGTDANGCTSKDTATVTLFVPPLITANALQTGICNGASTTLTASGALNFSWSPSAGISSTSGTSLTANPILSTTYTIIGTDINGCKDTTTLPITVNPLPSAAASPDENICVGSSTQLNATGGNYYSWSPSSSLNSNTISNPVASPGTSTQYLVIVTNQFGCKDSALANVFVHPIPIADAGPSKLVCFPDTILLQGNGSNFFHWTPSTYLSDSTAQYVQCIPQENITYTLTVNDSFGCRSNDTVSVKVIKPFVIDATGDAQICRSENLQLNAVGGNNYHWTPENGLDNPWISNPIASPSYTTTYTVYSSDGVCFDATDSAVVSVIQLPMIYAGADVSVMYGQTYQLNAYSNGGAIQWTPSTFLDCTDCINPIASHVNTPIEYFLTVTDSFGCRAEDSVFINLFCYDDLLYIPDAFTPNGDNKNDIFRIRTYGISHLDAFRVFNRWGELVFETDNVSEGWDGTWHGEPCTPAVYVWYFQGTCENGFTLTKKGNVTLIR